jgi:hypothetical protein
MTMHNYHGVKLVSPWWAGMYRGDHLFWYCPQRQAEVHDLVELDLDPPPMWEGSAIHPGAGDICAWCQSYYNATRPLIEQDTVMFFSHGDGFIDEYTYPVAPCS